MTADAQARELALRIAGANHSRRLYGERGAMWEKTLRALKETIEGVFEGAEDRELTFALLGEGLAVSGVPVLDPPSAVVRFIGQLKERDVEIISLQRGCELSELEALFSFLGADAADVAAVRADAWLRERGVQHVGIKHLRLMKGDRGETFRDVFWRGKRQLAPEFERAANQGVVSGGAVGELARSLLEVVAETKTPVATLLALRDRDDYTLVHSVNVGVLCGCQAAALGLSAEASEAVVMAGLLHDIGKTKVPEGVLAARTGRLSDREEALLARHTVEGARVLFQMNSRERVPAIVALEHHAAAHAGEERPLAVELCRLADVFDVIRTLRPFDDARTMRSAVAYMVQRLASRFNPFLLERFAAMLGLFQVGDHARLSSGEFVKIVEVDAELMLHPVVEVLDKSTGRWARGRVERVSDELDAPRVLPALSARFRDLEPEEIDALG